ncbi:AAA family ATPase [Knoellia sp. CPCC 206450]|uniref:AAA family ATPase n=1 Tax=Knoellia tibetensis TaxID=3404798 RepID=UPI003B429D03
MTVGVVTAVSHHHEQELVSALESASGLDVVRRCADVAELLSTGASGVADLAVVSPDFRGLDRDALRHLAGHGVRVAGLVVSGDDAGEARLRQLGVRVLLRPGTDPDEVARTLVDLAEGGAVSGGAVPGGGSRGGGGQRAAGAGTAPLGDDELAAWLDGTVGPGGSLSSGDGTDRLRRSGGRTDGHHPDEPGDAAAGAPRRARITAVWGPTGAPGRTTLALTMAATLAARGVSTLLVDLDTWGASVAQALALIDEAPGVAAAARASEQGALDRASLSRVAPEVTPGLRVLTGIPKPERWPELRAAAVEDVLEKSRTLVEHVVVDCGFAIEDDEELSYDTAAPRRNATTLTALECADDLVVVGSADPIGLQRLVRAVQDVGVVPSPQPVVVVNKVRSSATGSAPERAITDVLGRFAGLEDPHFVPWAPDECDAALLAGRSLVEQSGSGIVADAVARVVDAVCPEHAAPDTRAGRRGRVRLGRRTRRSA